MFTFIFSLTSLLLNVCQTMSGTIQMTVFNNRGFDLFLPFSTSFSSHSSLGAVGVVSTEFRFRYFFLMVGESEALRWLVNAMNDVRTKSRFSSHRCQ